MFRKSSLMVKVQWPNKSEIITIISYNMKNMYSFICKCYRFKGNCAIKLALGGGRIHFLEAKMETVVLTIKRCSPIFFILKTFFSATLFFRPDHN